MPKENCITSAIADTVGRRRFRRCRASMSVSWTSTPPGSSRRIATTVRTVFRCVASRNRCRSARESWGFLRRKSNKSPVARPRATAMQEPARVTALCVASATTDSAGHRQFHREIPMPTCWFSTTFSPEWPAKRPVGALRGLQVPLGTPTGPDGGEIRPRARCRSALEPGSLYPKPRTAMRSIATGLAQSSAGISL